MNPRTALGRAVSGANLAADTRHSGVDVLAALGAAQQGEEGLNIVRAALDLPASQVIPRALEQLPGMLVRARWCGNDTATLYVVGLTRVLVRWVARKEGWEPTAEQLAGLVGALVADVMGSEACQDCKGRGLRYDEIGRYQGLCTSCHGSGQRACTTVTDRAKRIGVSRQAYYRTWAERFDMLRDVLLQCERRLLGKTRKKLGRNCDNSCADATAGV